MSSRLNDGKGQPETDASANSMVLREDSAQDSQTTNVPRRTAGLGLSGKVRSWTLGNISTAATVLIFAFILLKVMVVAGGEPATARALIEGAAPVAVLMDAFLTLAPMVVAFLFVRLGEMQLRSKERGRRATMFTIAFMLSTYLAVATVPVMLLAGAIVGTLLGAWTDRRNRQRGDQSGVRLPMANSWTGTILGLLVIGMITVMNSGLWVPAENVSMKDGRQYVAYFTSSRDGWVTLFDKQKRQVIRERVDNIESREICGGVTGVLYVPLSRLPRSRNSDPHYPRCKT
jgi:hypothetical protein